MRSETNGTKRKRKVRERERRERERGKRRMREEGGVIQSLHRRRRDPVNIIICSLPRLDHRVQSYRIRNSLTG
jgi:hypothetical protein